MLPLDLHELRCLSGIARVHPNTTERYLLGAALRLDCARRIEQGLRDMNRPDLVWAAGEEVRRQGGVILAPVKS